jgi:hypothetical protein
VIPAGTTFVSATQTSGPTFALTHPSVGGTGTLSGTIASLAAGSSAHFVVVVLVTPSFSGASIANTAAVTTATTDPNVSDNSQTVSTAFVAPTLTVASVMATESTASSRPTLSILGLESTTGNDSALTYTWSVAQAPSGAKPVTFSENGTNAAKGASARFQKAGTYQLLCTISDGVGGTVTQPVSITIKQVATRLRLTPHQQVISAGGTLQYAAQALDQFGHAMRTASTTTYAVTSGDGTISNSGLFSAGQIQSHVVIEMTDDGLTGTLGATIV